MTAHKEKVNGKNLKLKCLLRGMTITQLAIRIGRARATLHHAVNNPGQFRPTIQKIEEALNE